MKSLFALIVTVVLFGVAAACAHEVDSITHGKGGGGSAGNAGTITSGNGGAGGAGVAGSVKAGAGGVAGKAGSGAIGGAGKGGAGGSGIGVPCGSKVCSVGEVCCNASCSICAKPNEGCIALYCIDAGLPGVTCGDLVCAAGEICCGACPGEKPFCGNIKSGCPVIVCPTQECQADSECTEKGYYCQKTEGQCLTTGICQPIAGGMTCAADCPGVCGCDGKQYCNACIARVAGVNVANQGACDCKVQDAVGQGMCDAFFGYAWTGSDCSGLSGCSCQGADCGSIFKDLESCRKAYQVCLPDDCRKTGCKTGYSCGVCWVGYSCIPDGAIC